MKFHVKRPAGFHVNHAHLVDYGPAVYVGARLYLWLVLQVGFSFPERWIWCVTALVVTLLVFVVNDKPLLGRENADNGVADFPPDGIYPGYAIWEVLTALPFPAMFVLTELLLLR